MDVSHHLILLGAALVLLSIFAGLFSARLGAPLLLAFLGLGMLAGEDGPGGIRFDDFQAAYLIGSIALAVVLLDGGLHTHKSMLRRAAAPALSLATIGVLITAGVTGVAAKFLFDISWLQGLLIGVITASTDAAAVFGLLKSSRIELHERVKATLEVESGANDPMAIFLTVLLVSMLTGKSMTLDLHPVALFLIQMAGGGGIGLAGGYALLWLINRVDIAQGMYPLLAVAGGLFVFSAAQSVGASGFLAIYIVGLVLGNHRHRASQVTSRFLDAFSWLSQIVMFLMLGLLVTPSQLVPLLTPALLIAAVLIFFARPLAVAVCLLPFRFGKREILFVSWVGLRGAVPIFLATVPVLAQAPGGKGFFAVAFVVVMVSLTIQGWTVATAARRLRLTLPPLPPESERLDFDLPGKSEQGSAIAGYRIGPESGAIGHAPDALPLPGGAQVVLTLRDGVMAGPGGIDRLAPEDYVLVMGKAEDISHIDRLFGPRNRRRSADASGMLGAFSFDANARLEDLGKLYGIPVEGLDPAMSVGDYLRRSLRAAPAVGDRLTLGAVELVVQDMDGTAITRVGLDLEPQPDTPLWQAVLRRWRPNSVAGPTVPRLPLRQRLGQKLRRAYPRRLWRRD